MIVLSISIRGFLLETVGLRRNLVSRAFEIP
jgi:hypothetical protein